MEVNTSEEIIIRDAVHGDIPVNKKFIRIIDTPEFQRLHRIRQLSTAYFIFPNAQHTRFSHSIGTYYIMQLLIKHFKPILDSINIKIDERDEQLALGVALLHDIGHGPFSHAFEGALPYNENQKKHEEWTIDIVTSRESNVQRVLVENFDDKFPEDLAELIKKERDIKKHRKEYDYSEVDLFFVISSLISSQLDADRMDYLLRDALFTGVSHGIYDISRLISSLTVTVHNNKYYVCVQEKYLPTIEEYLLARYQMHQGVYLHSFKCEMELLVKKILRRAFELYHKKIFLKNDVPEALASNFEGKDMTIEEYISLDDTVLISIFAKWKQSSDTILSLLCSGFLDRKKFKKLAILNNNENEINLFKEELINILHSYNYNVSNIESEFFWLEDKVKNETYKDRKDNIWILRKNGTLCDLFEVSRLITDQLKYEEILVYISLDMLKQVKEIRDAEMATEEISNLIKLYNNRNYIEIEKKYSINNKDAFEKVISAIKKLKQYNIEDLGQGIIQIDEYFDTPDKTLFVSNRTLRLRQKEGVFYLTIKTPTKGSFPVGEQELQDCQNERFEYEINVTSNSIIDNKQFILKYIPDIATRFNQMKKSLVVRNMRKKAKLLFNDVQFEIVFDDVTYEGVKNVHDYQIEIELKSDFLHRVSLKMLTDYLESNIPELTYTTKSKYERGLELTC